MHKFCPVVLTNCFEIGDIKQLTTCIDVGVTKTYIIGLLQEALQP